MRSRSRLAVAGLLVAGLGAGWALRPEQVGPGVLPNGQRLDPLGEAVTFRGRPIDLALAPDGKTLYAKDSRGLVVVDVGSWTLRQELSFPRGGGSLHGLVVTADGKRVLATNSENQLFLARVGADGKLAWEKTIGLPGPEGKGASFPCGLALARGDRTVYVCLSRNNTVAEVDLATGELRRQMRVGVAPFDVVVLPGGGSLAVSNWGGRHPRPGETVADSAGTPTLVDARGVAKSGSVSFVDLGRGREILQVSTGLHPSDLALSPDGKTLYSADANSDTVTVIDVRTRKRRATWPVRPDARQGFGSQPNALALSGDGKTLFVACGGENAVARIPASGGPTDWLPAGWYPGAVIAHKGALFVADVKGVGSRGEVGKDPGRGVYQFAGTIRRIALPGKGEAIALTRKARTLAGVEAAVAGRARSRVTLPPIEHVVYVIKENRTYDQVFGDLPQGDGEATLCLFGRDVTPNHHALAEEFVLLDNFYCNGVLSADGHEWATEGMVTDHLEKAFGGFTRSYTFGDDALTYASSGFLWDAALENGKTFFNFGEMDYADETPNVGFGEVLKDWETKAGKVRWGHKIGIERLKKHSHPEYPGWNMDIPDVVRAAIFLKTLARWETTGAMPHLTIVYLPSDHTTGNTPGGPTPRAYLADNDLALGRIVEGISRSRFWPKTAIFVVEDDPQDGFDHVDGHRSLCLVVSPYARRGQVISAFYNQTSVLHTMLRLLGAGPLNRMDAMAPVMSACFSDRPDLRPYACRPNGVPLTETVPKTAVSGRLDYSRPDRAGDDALNRELWRAVKADSPYPAQLAGAHGTGLAERGLRLSARLED